MIGMNLSTFANMLKNGANIVDTKNQNVSKYAMVLNGVCVGVTLWNGDSNTWMPPENVTMIQLESSSPISPGWFYSDGTWTAPPPVEMLEEIP